MTKNAESLLKPGHSCLMKQVSSDGQFSCSPRLLPFNYILLTSLCPLTGVRSALVWSLPAYSCSLSSLSFTGISLNKFIGCLLPSWCFLLTGPKLIHLPSMKKQLQPWPSDGQSKETVFLVTDSWAKEGKSTSPSKLSHGDYTVGI